MGAWAWLNAGNQGTVTFSIDGTFVVPDTVNYLTASRFFIDARGRSVTLTGGNLYLLDCSNFAIANIRHRGGWNPGISAQSADNWSLVGCADFYLLQMSASNSYDEGISPTSNCRRYTLDRCLFGPGDGGTASSTATGVTHNFASLAYGYTADMNGPGSYILNAFVAKDYRNPKLGYHGDGDQGFSVAHYSTPSPNAIDYDVVNNVTAVCNIGLSVELGAKANVVGGYDYNSATPTDTGTGGSISTSLPVLAAARVGVSVLSATQARDRVKANDGTGAGAYPRDAFDTTLLARIL